MEETKNEGLTFFFFFGCGCYVQVVLKIIKHCKQCVPAFATGQLLGLALRGAMEVTNCFPRLDEEDAQDAESYQINMMKCLRRVNADTNTVGWYRTAFLGSCFNDSMIESQLAYQSDIKNSVVLVYDPLASATSGTLALKAYRLSDDFMSKYTPATFTSTRFVFLFLMKKFIGIITCDINSYLFLSFKFG